MISVWLPVAGCPQPDQRVVVTVSRPLGKGPARQVLPPLPSGSLEEFGLQDNSPGQAHLLIGKGPSCLPLCVCVCVHFWGVHFCFSRIWLPVHCRDLLQNDVRTMGQGMPLPLLPSPSSPKEGPPPGTSILES